MTDKMDAPIIKNAPEKVAHEIQAERANPSAPLKAKIEALLKEGSEFSDITSLMSVAQRKAFSEAVRSWNFEINQIIKSL
jgi:hypothetical protein